MNLLFNIVSSLKCFGCISGKCLTSPESFGSEITCNGNDPVCVKQVDGNKVVRVCEYSNAYAPLRPLSGQCLAYKGKETCFCTEDKCNSVPVITPMLFLIMMPFFFAVALF
jgi:hypothetical protein